MNRIVQTGDDFYFVGPGYRTYLGKTPTGLAESGVPVLQIGQPGAPASAESLWEIPDLKEMMIEAKKQAEREGTN